MSVSRTNGFGEEVRAWLAECLPRAIVYARSLVRDVGEADDVVQECVYRLLKRAAHYDLPQDGSRLLFRAVTNECINRTTRGPNWVSLETTDEEGHSFGSTIGDARAEQPLDRMLTDELRQVLDAALDELPVAQRGALELKSLGYSLEEIAQALFVTANHAGVLVHRARKAVRERIAMYWSPSAGCGDPVHDPVR
jgi:RNA polymerase sigma factor (sigma-70 family)